MAVEFGTGKTICILAIVVGCFAVLWPKLFYPMLQASVNARNPVDNSQGKANDGSGLFLNTQVEQKF
jgi:hypothetical protein